MKFKQTEAKLRSDFIKEIAGKYITNTKEEFYEIVSVKFNEIYGKSWTTTGVKRFIQRHKIDLADYTIKKKLDNVNTNTMVTTTDYKSPLTEEDVIRLFNIDETIWEACNIVTNVWTVTNKYGNTFPNFQTKITWKRIVPLVTEIPALSQVTIKLPVVKEPVLEDNTGYMKALVFGDSQIGYRRDIESGELKPFHDRKCLDIMVQLAEIQQPDTIVLLGDMLDLPEWSSKFLKSPEFYFTTQPAIEEFYYWLCKLSMAAPDASIIYLEGNHEFRMNRAVIEHLLAAYSIKPASGAYKTPSISIKSLLNLDELGITYLEGYPKNRIWLNENLKISHGSVARKGSGDSVKAMLADATYSQIVGHGHRQEKASKTSHPNKGPRTYTCCMVGTTARIDGAVPSNTSNENWQQGCCMLYYDTELFDIHLLSINDGILLYNDFCIKGNPDIEDLNISTGNKWKF